MNTFICMFFFNLEPANLNEVIHKIFYLTSHKSHYMVNSSSSVHIYRCICWEPTGSNQHDLWEKYLICLKLNEVSHVIKIASCGAKLVKDFVKLFSPGTHSDLIWQSSNSLSIMACRLMLVREMSVVIVKLLWDLFIGSVTRRGNSCCCSSATYNYLFHLIAKRLCCYVNWCNIDAAK